MQSTYLYFCSDSGVIGPVMSACTLSRNLVAGGVFLSGVMDAGCLDLVSKQTEHLSLELFVFFSICRFFVTFAVLRISLLLAWAKRVCHCCRDRWALTGKDCSSKRLLGALVKRNEVSLNVMCGLSLMVRVPPLSVRRPTEGSCELYQLSTTH